ncbi:1-hydroxycarotenoid 3,4-desaturase CrtD [Sulfitobacter sp. LCG007]
MRMSPSRFSQRRKAVVIGAGIGGLAAALTLAVSEFEVVVLERHPSPGGKLRAISTLAGPADAGPTVLTLRGVFDALFASAGARLDEHLTLVPQEILARHFWPGGGVLDLFCDRDRSRRAIAGFAGRRDADAFDRFCADTARLFEAFDAPVMRAPVPSRSGVVGKVIAQPGLVPMIAPHRTLHHALARRFRDPRLVQLFGRYATYVGGSPYHSPAILSLIWQAEARGVWSIAGGMHRLARSLADLAEAKGVGFLYGTDVERIETAQGRATGIVLRSGQRIGADAVVFNGDPRALALGGVGPELSDAAKSSLKSERSLSARVWSFAARVRGPDLAHHNVFFTNDPQAEFDALQAGRLPRDPTLYVCAQDRGAPALSAPDGPERFEIIANAAPLTRGAPPVREFETCQTVTFGTLAKFGLNFDRLPASQALTTPTGFEALFPGSAGSLYGQSPHDMMATFRRPTARTGIAGLYLAGGGVHPGPGVPMAALSGRHAAEAIMQDLALTWTCRPMATPGGTSTA